MDVPSSSFVEAGLGTVKLYSEIVRILFALNDFVVRHEEFHDIFFFSFVCNCRVKGGIG